MFKPHVPNVNTKVNEHGPFASFSLPGQISRRKWQGAFCWPPHPPPWNWRIYLPQTPSLCHKEVPFPSFSWTLRDRSWSASFTATLAPAATRAALLTQVARSLNKAKTVGQRVNHTCLKVCCAVTRCVRLKVHLAFLGGCRYLTSCLSCTNQSVYLSPSQCDRK